MQVMGHFARVALDPIKRALVTEHHCLDHFLGPSERQVFMNCATRKRQAEFIGGRIAVKLAFAIGLRESSGTEVSFSCMDIPAKRGMVTLYLRGRPMATASVSHSGRWAVAFVPTTGIAAIDVEDNIWQGRTLQECFSPHEWKDIGSQDDARTCWTLKECYAKLFDGSNFDLINDAVVWRSGIQRWIAIRQDHSLSEETAMGIFTWGSLSVCIGLSPKSGVVSETS